jgi:hypothetical protein
VDDEWDEGDSVRAAHRERENTEAAVCLLVLGRVRLTISRIGSGECRSIGRNTSHLENDCQYPEAVGAGGGTQIYTNSGECRALGAPSAARRRVD